MAQNYLLVSEIFPPKTGGSGRWFWDLYTRLDKDNLVVFTDEVEGAEVVDGESGILTYRSRLASNEWGLLSFSGVFFYLRVIIQVVKLVRKHKITSIHCGRTLPEGVVGLAVKLLTRVSYSCYVHGEDIEMCRSSKEFTWMVRQVVKHSRHLICNSENSAKLLRNGWGAKEEQIVVLNPGVDASRFCPTNSSCAESCADKKIILTVSRLQARKGHDMLIRALSSILESHPDLLYVIVGSGEEYDNLTKLVEDLSLGKFVKFLGECSDDEIIRLYGQADLFVLPNRTIGNDVEGFGIVLLEAQSCGTAVVAGDSGGTRETMALDVTGKIVDCTKPDELGEVIVELFDNPERLRMMGEKARERVLQKFDWPVVIDRARRIFES